MAALASAGCGGRIAKPLPAETVLDDRLTCAHLSGELDNNQKRLVELEGEKKQSSANNVGLLVTSPLFLDTQGTFKKETDALNVRNERLKMLLSERGCVSPEVTPPEPAPADPQT